MRERESFVQFWVSHWEAAKPRKIRFAKSFLEAIDVPWTDCDKTLSLHLLVKKVLHVFIVSTHRYCAKDATFFATPTNLCSCTVLPVSLRPFSQPVMYSLLMYDARLKSCETMALKPDSYEKRFLLRTRRFVALGS